MARKVRSSDVKTGLFSQPAAGLPKPVFYRLSKGYIALISRMLAYVTGDTELI